MKFYFVFLILFPALFQWAEEAQYSGFSIVAGKRTTEIGAVMIAHNEDEKGKDYFVNVHKVQGGAVKKIKGFFWFEIPGGECGDSYMNESGLVITSNACESRETRAELSGSGIGGKLGRVLAEQAGTARLAVEIAGQLIEKYGYYASGHSFAIADTNEAWILQVVRGKHWVAKRVPEDEMAVVSNRFTIDAIDFNDKLNFKGAPDIIDYAIRKGWYNPKVNGPFNFTQAYAAPESNRDEGNVLREWRAVSLLAKKKFAPTDSLPFSFKPKTKVELADFFGILRDHYEDSQFDVTRDSKVDSPHKTSRRTICSDATRYSFVAQMRSEPVREIANILWIAFSCPDSNAYSPWYFSISTLPEGYTRGNSESVLPEHIPQPASFFRYSPEYAFWSYTRLSHKVEASYRTSIKIVRKEWQNFENYLMKMQKKKEKEFTYFLKKNKRIALKLIANYVAELEYRKWFLANELIEQLKK